MGTLLPLSVLHRCTGRFILKTSILEALTSTFRPERLGTGCLGRRMENACVPPSPEVAYNLLLSQVVLVNGLMAPAIIWEPTALGLVEKGYRVLVYGAFRFFCHALLL
jgi:hypothetical protein